MNVHTTMIVAVELPVFPRLSLTVAVIVYVPALTGVNATVLGFIVSGTKLIDNPVLHLSPFPLKETLNLTFHKVISYSMVNTCYFNCTILLYIIIPQLIYYKHYDYTHEKKIGR
ncbi:MAG: hypothetical protein QSU88_12450, partial [Candidatus Methanoperedens sp.]|nr:hypothetical protein [Candidatus Methanoperedens sp.]